MIHYSHIGSHRHPLQSIRMPLWYWRELNRVAMCHYVITADNICQELQTLIHLFSICPCFLKDHLVPKSSPWLSNIVKARWIYGCFISNEFLTCIATGIKETEKMFRSEYCHKLIFMRKWRCSNPQTVNSKMKTFALQITAF